MLEALVQDLVGSLSLLIAGVIATLIGMGIKSLNAYLKTRMSVENLAFLKGVASTIVRYVEQSAAFQEIKLQGADKKQRALMMFSEYCAENDIPLDYGFMDKLIEEAVNLMNSMVKEEL